MAATGKSGKSRAKSSNQGWSPNSGQDAELEFASLVDVFVSEQGQHSCFQRSRITSTESASRHTDAACIFNESATERSDSVPADWDQSRAAYSAEPPTVRTLDQYQPTGNNETPLAVVDLNSDAIVDAQLTHLISRDDAPQGQDAPNASDVPMPDTPTVHDSATPRRTVASAA